MLEWDHKWDDVIKKLIEETSWMTEEEKVGFLFQKNALLKQYVQQHLADLFDLDEKFFTKDANVILSPKETLPEPKIVVIEKKYPEPRTAEELDRIRKLNNKKL